MNTLYLKNNNNKLDYYIWHHFVTRSYSTVSLVFILPEL